MKIVGACNHAVSMPESGRIDQIQSRSREVQSGVTPPNISVSNTLGCAGAISPLEHAIFVEFEAVLIA